MEIAGLFQDFLKSICFEIKVSCFLGWRERLGLPVLIASWRCAGTAQRFVFREFDTSKTKESRFISFLILRSIEILNSW